MSERALEIEKHELIKEIEKLELTGLKEAEELLKGIEDVIKTLKSINKHLKKEDFAEEKRNFLHLINALRNLHPFEEGIKNAVNHLEPQLRELITAVNLQREILKEQLCELRRGELMRLAEGTGLIKSAEAKKKIEKAIEAELERLKNNLNIKLKEENVFDVKEAEMIVNILAPLIKRLKEEETEFIHFVRAGTEFISKKEFEKASEVFEKCIGFLEDIKKAFKAAEKTTDIIEKFEKKHCALDIAEKRGEKLLHQYLA